MKILTILLFFTLINLSFAQTDSYFEMLRSDLKSEKVAVITDIMKFTDKEAEGFWPVYRQYEFEVSKLGDETLKLIKEYAENYSNMTNETAEKILLKSFDLKEERLELKREYFGKFSKVIEKTRAAKFMQLDNQIDLVLDLQITKELPLLDELSK